MQSRKITKRVKHLATISSLLSLCFFIQVYRKRKDLIQKFHHFVRDSRYVTYMLNLFSFIWGASLSNFAQVRTFFSEQNKASDVSYGVGERHKLDVYYSNPTARMSVLLFVHGGVWNFGNKEMYRLLGHHMRQKSSVKDDDGLVVCVMNYTPYTYGAHSNVQVNEINMAIDWIEDNISAFGGDPSRITVSGHSSGAHISMLALILRGINNHIPQPTYALNEKDTKKWNTVCKKANELFGPFGKQKHKTRNQVSKFVAISGVYDIGNHYLFEKKRGVHELSAMAPVNKLNLSSLKSPYSVKNFLQEIPTEFHGILPPHIILVHGLLDFVVPVDQSDNLFRELTRFSISSLETVYIENYDHAQPVLKLLGLSKVGPYDHKTKMEMNLEDIFYVQKNMRSKI